MSVNICNQALSHVGGQLIESLQASSTESKLCNLHYPTARKAVLTTHEWTFARKRATLNAIDPAEPVPGFGNTFLLPDDNLRVTKVSHDPAYLDMHRVDYDIVMRDDDQKVLAANEDVVHIIYIFNQENFEVFSDGFTLALSYKLASLLAIPLAQSHQLKERMEDEYENHRRIAEANDGRQLRSQRLRAKQFIDIRQTGGRAFTRW